MVPFLPTYVYLLLCSSFVLPPLLVYYTVGRRREAPPSILFLDKIQSCAPDLAYTHRQKNEKKTSEGCSLLRPKFFVLASVLYTFAASLAKKEKKGRINHFFPHFFSLTLLWLGAESNLPTTQPPPPFLCHHPDHHHLLPPPSIFFLSCYKVRGPPSSSSFSSFPPYNRFLERSIKEQGRCRCCLFFSSSGNASVAGCFSQRREEKKEEDAESTLVGRNFPLLLEIYEAIFPLPPFPPSLL